MTFLRTTATLMPVTEVAKTEATRKAICEPSRSEISTNGVLTSVISAARKVTAEPGGNVGAQDVRQGSFDGLAVDCVAFVVKDIMPIVLSDPVFIEQGGDITAELGNLVADGDIIFISRSNA